MTGCSSCCTSPSRSPPGHPQGSLACLKPPKRYLIDPALLVPLWQLDTRAVLRDGDVLGRVIDTFVANQLRAECTIAESAPTIHHLRQADGRREVDLILEGPAGRIVAIEIKASAAVDLEAARHLIWLRDELGDQFACGVVFHTGPLAFRLEERVWALPIAAIWAKRPLSSAAVMIATIRLNTTVPLGVGGEAESQLARPVSEERGGQG